MQRPVLLLDSITAINALAGNAIIVSGSHGGASSTGFALANATKPYLVFFNDAGRGKDDAGIYCLAALEAAGIACACYSHNSARIGEATDGLENGIVSCCNGLAKNAGIAVGARVKDCCAAVL